MWLIWYSRTDWAHFTQFGVSNLCSSPTGETTLVNKTNIRWKLRVGSENCAFDFNLVYSWNIIQPASNYPLTFIDMYSNAMLVASVRDDLGMRHDASSAADLAQAEQKTKPNSNSCSWCWSGYALLSFELTLQPDVLNMFALYVFSLFLCTAISCLQACILWSNISNTEAPFLTPEIDHDPKTPKLVS